MSIDPHALVGRLTSQVGIRRLQSDPAQTVAAARLDALREALRGPPGGLLGRLGARLSRLASASAEPPVRGVYLWGGVGRGKTLLMDLFHGSLEAAGIASERAHFYHLMRDVHAALGTIKQHSAPLEVVADRFAVRARVLCLDELFVTDIADAMILAGLFGGMFRRGVTLVATSNLPPHDLYKDGLQRQRFLPAIAMLESHLDVLHLDGRVDYRLRELKQAPLYLDANLASTPARLQDRFTALAGGDEHGAGTLMIEGRALRALGTGPGLAWFEFAQLCDGPRSQNDYIELARRYHTLILSNVPVFGVDDENAARRFIMLIDELYDRSVKLVLSAAAPPTQLYRGEKLRFEFERAASRLMEMQTEEYLSGGHRQ